MSFLSNLNPFKSASTAPAANADSQNSAPNQNPAPSPGAQGNQNDPNANKTLQQVNPLDAFAKMYDTDPNPQVPPQFALAPEALDAAAKANDFSRGFDPELKAKMMAGDPAAFEAYGQHIGRMAYRAALEHSSVLTGKFTEAREQFNAKGMGQKVRGELTAHELASTPNYSHPVVKQQLAQTAEHLQRQHPDASPKEIADMTRKYFAELSNAIHPSAPKETVPQGQTNWDDFFAADGQ